MKRILVLIALALSGCAAPESSKPWSQRIAEDDLARRSSSPMTHESILQVTINERH